MRKLFIGGVSIFLIIFTASFASAAGLPCIGNTCYGAIVFIDSSGTQTATTKVSIKFTTSTGPFEKEMLYAGVLTFTDPNGNDITEDITVLSGNLVNGTWTISGTSLDIIYGEGIFEKMYDQFKTHKVKKAFVLAGHILGPSTNWTGSFWGEFFAP